MTSVLKKQQFVSHAKWIMAGEHTVVEGGKALAFPLRKFEMSLEYEPSSVLYLKSDSSFSSAESLSILIDLFRDAALFCGKNDVSGNFTLNSNIMPGAGLGSSAALCVNIAKFFEYFGLCSTYDVYPLARHLENKFHGKSSGLDISVALLNKGVIFENNKFKCSIMNIKFWPYMLLTYCGETSKTLSCTKKVQLLREKQPSKADNLDYMMHKGVNLCESGLKKGSFSAIRDGIISCNEAFKGWELYNEALESCACRLIESGAVAVKPVGSGLGGFVLSLWKEFPAFKFKKNSSFLLERP